MASKKTRVEQAQTKINSLVRQGYRLNKKAVTSNTYQQAVSEQGSAKERKAASEKLTKGAMSPTGKWR